MAIMVKTRKSILYKNLNDNIFADY